MEADSKFVLAMYDVRGKQDFIFRTNRIKEIVGASWIIRDIFRDYLFPAVLKYSEKGIYSYQDISGQDVLTMDGADVDVMEFSAARFRKHIEAGYIGELIYDGGGAYLVLFRDKEAFQKVTYEFTKNVTKYIGTLQVIGTYIEIDSFDDYSNDEKRLKEKHKTTEAVVPMSFTTASLPITEMNRKTAQPMFHQAGFEKASEMMMYSYGSMNVQVAQRQVVSSLRYVEGNKISKEQYIKRLKFELEMGRIKGMDENDLNDLEKLYFRNNESILDNILDEDNSKLAIVYIDGNNMGAKVEACIAGDSSYESCVTKLRRFSQQIQKVYVEDGIKNIFNSIEGTEDGEGPRFRIIVSAGDEVNFIVKASDAFSAAEGYLNALKERDDGSSACAGIAVFRSHSPYADAYRIAEECCETGKRLMKRNGIEVASFIDYHICQGATGTSLNSIRRKENGKIISRPWMMWMKDEDKDISASGIVSFEVVRRVSEFLSRLARSNVKGLPSAAKSSQSKFLLELRRCWGHSSESFKAANNEEWEWINSLDPVLLRNIVYDVAIAFDLWFEKKGGKTVAE